MYSDMSLLINSFVSDCSGFFSIVLITSFSSKIFLISVSTVDAKLFQVELSIRDRLTARNKKIKIIIAFVYSIIYFVNVPI